MPNEFSGSEVALYPGHVVGIRAMLMEEGGRLYSPQQHFLWMEGENKASCVYFDGRSNTRVRMQVYSMNVGGMIYASGPEVSSEEHTIACKDCTCGFYAYFSENHADNYLPSDDGIYAIVKGYGRVTYGDLGFRAEKMEIIALVETGYHDPGDMEKPVAPKPMAMWPFVVGLSIATTLLVTGLVMTFTQTLPFPLNGVVSWAGAGLSILVSKWQRRRSAKHHKAFLAYAKETQKWIRYSANQRRWSNRKDYKPARVVNVRHRYPDIPFYESVEEALESNVLTDPLSIE